MACSDVTVVFSVDELEDAHCVELCHFLEKRLMVLLFDSSKDQILVTFQEALQRIHKFAIQTDETTGNVASVFEDATISEGRDEPLLDSVVVSAASSLDLRDEVTLPGSIFQRGWQGVDLDDISFFCA